MSGVTDPFDLSPLLRESVAPGTNLLVIGGAMSDKHDVFLEVLTGGFDERDAAVVASTNGEAVSFVDAIADRAGTDEHVRGIDCSQEGPLADDRVTSVNSPADLTGIGMHVDRHLGTFSEAGRRCRLGFSSISTLLVYSDFQPVYRFLHVITGRVSATEGLGVFVVDNETHDEQALSAITSLFDARIRVEEDGTSVSGLE